MLPYTRGYEVIVSWKESDAGVVKSETLLTVDGGRDETSSHQF